MQVKFGFSLSIKQCRNFGVELADVLQAALNDLGAKRFRIMSYWNEHEQQPGVYDFSLLDKQVDMIEKAGGEISLCLGARQPRWPENHWPDWAWKLPKPERDSRLTDFISAVVERYKDRTVITSYQLENEALLENFGERPDVDRERLRAEYALVKRLDPKTPIIMTTSTSWGIPLRRPIPDIVGFSFYQTVYQNGGYHRSFHRPWLHKYRAWIIKLIWRRPCFIHELQLEPWGPKNIWEMSSEEQDKSMSLQQMQRNIAFAKNTGLQTVDMWGLEWWYWRKQQGDERFWNYIQQALAKSS